MKEDEEAVEKMLAIIRPHVEALRLHFDTVQIFCTKLKTDEDLASVTDNGTFSFRLGEGNYYARFGQVSMWVHDQLKENEDAS